MKERDPKEKPGQECADEIFDDDGRNDDGKNHKGDWGSHSLADKEHENCQENQFTN